MCNTYKWKLVLYMKSGQEFEVVYETSKSNSMEVINELSDYVNKNSNSRYFYSFKVNDTEVLHICLNDIIAYRISVM